MSDGLNDPLAGLYEVHGSQPVRPVPQIPVTQADFQALLDNPGAPAENQSAPALDKLNPHLFPQS